MYFKSSYIKAILFLILFFALSLFFSTTAFSNSESPSVVFSEIKIAGVSGYDEFVEFYNPTSNDISLEGWVLKKKSGSSTTESTIYSFSSTHVKAYSYLLLMNKNAPSEATPSAEFLYASSIGSNNTLILKDDTQNIIDKVGMGSAADFETAVAVEPEANKSIERKAYANSTALTMLQGGTDELNGNGYDSDNNQFDFLIRDLPQPQNSGFSTEIRLSSPTPTPTQSPTPTPSLTPTSTPFATPSPTPSASSTPVVSPVPTSTTQSAFRPTCRIHLSIKKFGFMRLPLLILRCL